MRTLASASSRGTSPFRGTAAEAVVPGENVAWAAVLFGLVLTAVGVLFAMLAARRPPRLPARLDTLLLAHLAVLVALWLGRAATGTLPW